MTVRDLLFKILKLLWQRKISLNTPVRLRAHGENSLGAAYMPKPGGDFTLSW